MLFCRAKSRVDFACAVRDLTQNRWKSRFCPQVFCLCLFWIDSVQWYVNDRNTVWKFVKLCSNECSFSQQNFEFPARPREISRAWGLGLTYIKSFKLASKNLARLSFQSFLEFTGKELHETLKLFVIHLLVHIYQKEKITLEIFGFKMAFHTKNFFLSY